MCEPLAMSCLRPTRLTFSLEALTADVFLPAAGITAVLYVGSALPRDARYTAIHFPGQQWMNNP